MSVINKAILKLAQSNPEFRQALKAELRKRATDPKMTMTMLRLRKGDKVMVMTRGLKKPRVLEVQENPRKHSGSDAIYVELSSGNTRPGHRSGGVLTYTPERTLDNGLRAIPEELTYQATMLQQTYPVTELKKVSEAQAERYLQASVDWDAQHAHLTHLIRGMQLSKPSMTGFREFLRAVAQEKATAKQALSLAEDLQFDVDRAPKSMVKKIQTLAAYLKTLGRNLPPSTGKRASVTSGPDWLEDNLRYLDREAFKAWEIRATGGKSFPDVMRKRRFAQLSKVIEDHFKSWSIDSNVELTVRMDPRSRVLVYWIEVTLYDIKDMQEDEVLGLIEMALGKRKIPRKDLKHGGKNYWYFQPIYTGWPLILDKK